MIQGGEEDAEYQRQYHAKMSGRGSA